MGELVFVLVVAVLFGSAGRLAYWCGIGNAGAGCFADCYCGDGADSPQ